MRARVLTGVVLGLAIVSPSVASVEAQQGSQSQLCLTCHGSPEVFRAHPNRGRLVVPPETVAASVHGAAGLECVTCHRQRGYPHVDAGQPIPCAACHADVAQQQSESLHGLAHERNDPLAPTCESCHGVHDVQNHLDPTAPTNVSNIPYLCGECHQEGTPVSQRRAIPQDSILENYSLSIHGQGFFEQGLTVTAVCTSCHTSHFILPHTDRRSSIHRDNVASTCAACHSRIEQVHVQLIEGRLWAEEPHKIPACVECHQPHRIRRVFYDAGVANQDCMRCHGDQTLTTVRGEDTVSVFVDELAYLGADHAGTTCAQCHSDVTSAFRERPCEDIDATVDCAVCHAEPVADYSQSMHGQLAAEGNPDAPGCMDCHDPHVTRPYDASNSPTFARNVPGLCAQCHRQGEPAAVRIGSDVDIVRSYEMSIHGTGLLESGLTVTATCPDCHTAHRELPPADTLSSVHPENLPGTCGTCHHGIEEQYRTSIHANGGEHADSDREYPSCESCHTSHTISRTDRDDFRLMMMSQCGRCHEEESETFFETFHGKVSRLGDAAVAKCSDCHGTHNILPVDDPRSTLSRANIVGTCSQCHENANFRFTGYLTHATHHDLDKYPYLFWAFWGMTGLLIGTMSFGLFHTGAWLWRLWRSPGQSGTALWRVQEGVLYRRFTAGQRMMHLVMILSFFTLALTGMVLKFSDQGWAQSFARTVGGFGTTGVLHRIGAIALITVFLLHLRDVFRKKRESGQTWLQFVADKNSIMFNKRDPKELWASIKWFVGKGPKPRYGRYTYWEKFDYFAVFWGMFIIGSTGLILWFPEAFTLVLPGWIVNVVTIIHSDEALLAVAFIFTIHFFNTHFRPGKFPMDPVIFTGRITLDELKEDRPEEYEEVLARGELEQNLVEPYHPTVERSFKVFGMTALIVGLTLILLILYSALFGYH